LPCIVKKICKYIPDCDIDEDPTIAIPKYLLEFSGLKKFWRLFIRIINISPLDNNNYPTLTMLQSYDGEIDMEADEFYNCLEISFIKLKETIKIKRKK